MKRLSIAVVAIAALAFATVAPASASDMRKQRTVELTGTITAISNTQLQLLVKTAPEGSILSRQVRGTKIWLTTDSATTFKRGEARTFASLMLNDRVNVRASVTLNSAVNPATLVWKALRINVMLPPAPKMNFRLTGVIVTNSLTVPGTLGLIVTKAEARGDSPFRGSLVLGTNLSLYVDSSTVVTKAGANVALSTLVSFPAVTVSGICTSTLPQSCTAKMIEVLVAR